MGSREKMGEHAGFGDFGGDMELEEGQNLPFGVPEEDCVVSMERKAEKWILEIKGEDGPFGAVMDMGEEREETKEEHTTEISDTHFRNIGKHVTDFRETNTENTYKDYTKESLIGRGYPENALHLPCSYESSTYYGNLYWYHGAGGVGRMLVKRSFAAGRHVDKMAHLA